jgi:hypothetical protein
MKEIENKIKEFIKLSKEATEDKEAGNWDSITEKMDKQDKMMTELTAMARAKKTLVGRIIKFSVADGYAIYVITKMGPTSVKLTWIDYCDGYCDRHYGERGGSMKIQDAMSYTRFEDTLDNMATR